ncbi:MAG: NUDIX hydrolase [Alphaproteobacteria bacterium]|nr:NUDIX hydrolase [Alphaproteobacteria bacterium]
MDGQVTQKPRPVAGAGIVVVRGDEVLVIQRGKPPYAGEWSIPGGKIEYGETAEEAALRELKEETGVEARIIGLIDVVDSIAKRQPGSDGDWHFLLIDYAAVWTAGEPVADDDVSDALFLPVKDAIARTRWDKTRDVIGRAVEMVSALPEPQSTP